MEAIDLIKEQGLYRKVTEDYNPAIVIDLMEKYAVQKYHELTDGKVVVNGQNRSDKTALSLLDVSNLLPSKYYEIEFSNHVKAGIQINNNTPLVVGAVNGYGDGISSNDIKITEKQ